MEGAFTDLEHQAKLAEVATNPGSNVDTNQMQGGGGRYRQQPDVAMDPYYNSGQPVSGGIEGFVQYGKIKYSFLFYSYNSFTN
jgi:hypothetical protein